MREPCFSIRQDVFGALSGMPKASVQLFWGVLLRVLPDNQGPVQLPSKIWADARKLVDAGIALEPEKGEFCVNPDVVRLSYEPPIQGLKK